MIAHRMNSRFLMSLAPALLAGATAFAQAPSTGGAPQQPSMPSQQPQAGSPTAGAPGAAPQNYADQAFIAKGMEGDDAEIQLGQLAQQKSQSNDVKQFAQEMISQHTQMNQKWFEPVAKQMNVSEPKGPSKKDKKLYAKLEALSGPQFDQEYITAMVTEHKKDLKDFKDESEAAQDPMVKQIAQEGSTVVAQHLQLAEQVAKNHNINVDETQKEVSSAR